MDETGSSHKVLSIVTIHPSINALPSTKEQGEQCDSGGEEEGEVHKDHTQTVFGVQKKVEIGRKDGLFRSDSKPGLEGSCPAYCSI
ncbi:hypothetical protein BLNAU_12027 [Blattamonas nauphoetae]|uniref:Uncharacterized protein n=1 Tax=Blattamonas nauphoetae TaxID=2049346 RepID=A0ABQ9XKU2_9EUKA|nr:hypothetical protein BLNAU_12027 [Blattamonas nauphoetae]